MPNGSCKNICKNYTSLPKVKGSMYSLGYKRCNVCMVFVKCSGYRCQCCNSQLRSRPRGKGYKDSHTSVGI